MNNKKQTCPICGEEKPEYTIWCDVCKDKLPQHLRDYFYPEVLFLVPEAAEWGAKRREETYKAHWKKVLERVKANSQKIEQSLKDEVEEEAKVPAVWDEEE